MAKLLPDYEAEVVSLVRDGTSVVLTVSGATNATPIVVTTATDHERKTNDRVRIEGVLGNTAANGSWALTVINSTQFSLTGSAGNGAYAGGGFVYYSGGILKNPDDVRKAITRALEQYSKKNPRQIVMDLLGDGTGEFAVSALTGFDSEFSGDVKIEYPISTSGEPNWIDRRDWNYYRKPTGLVIRMTPTPGLGQNARFLFKGVHSTTSAASTVPESDFAAVSKFGAAECCEDLARHYTQTSEGRFLQGDQAVYLSKAKEYEDRARTLRKQASEHVGAGSTESGPPAASVNVNWDLSDGLTHRRRHR